jgi:hypothetical protein
MPESFSEATTASYRYPIFKYVGMLFSLKSYSDLHYIQ